MGGEEKEGPSTRNITIKMDTRKSWGVCLGAFLVYGVCLGLINNFGVLFVSLLEEFQESKRKTAWVGSLQLILYCLLSSSTNAVTQTIGFRRGAIVGSVLFCLGFLLSSFAPNLWVLYLTYGVLSGVGGAFILSVCLSVPAFVFKKHLATVFGVVAAGNSVFTMCLSPVNEYLLRKYGLRMTFRLLSLWVLPMGLTCVLLPGKRQVIMPNDSSRCMDGEHLFILTRLLKHKPFALWLFVMSLLYLGLFIPLVHLISFSKDIGVPTNISVYSISCISSFEAIGKLATGKIVDYFRWDVPRINTIAILTLAVSITLLPTIDSVYQLLLFSAVNGFGTGVQAVCLLMLTPLLCRPKDAKQATMFVYTAVSIPSGAGPVIAAWIYDETQSYELAFFISGGIFALAACLSILPTVVQQTWKDTYNKRQVVDMKESLVEVDTNMDKETIS